MSDEFETHIRAIAKELVYPPIQTHRTKRLSLYPVQFIGRVAILIIVLGLTGFAVPDIRATVLEILRIGRVTITLDGTTLSGESLQLDDVYGETNLDDIQDQISFELIFPAEDLPDKAYLQEGELVIMVWLDSHDIQQVLYQIPDTKWAVFKSLDAITETTVNQDDAYWLDIQHPVQFVNGQIELTYFVDGNVLIWTDGIVTYRLETRLDMESARAFAEGLVTLP